MFDQDGTAMSEGKGAEETEREQEVGSVRVRSGWVRVRSGWVKLG